MTREMALKEWQDDASFGLKGRIVKCGAMEQLQVGGSIVLYVSVSNARQWTSYGRGGATDWTTTRYGAA